MLIQELRCSPLKFLSLPILFDSALGNDIARLLKKKTSRRYSAEYSQERSAGHRVSGVYLTMFPEIPFEIRSLIWQAVLRQPRVVYINMRNLPNTSNLQTLATANNFLRSECLSSTPIPVLLHVCKETRALALEYYELTFGRAGTPPMLRSPIVHTYGYRETGREWSYVSEGNEALVASYEPRIYFNFESDVVVFGRRLPAIGEESTTRSASFSFGLVPYFGARVTGRIERLGFSMEEPKEGEQWHQGFWYLDMIARRQRKMKRLQEKKRYQGFIVEEKEVLFPMDSLKQMYVCMAAGDLDSSRGLELVDLAMRKDAAIEDGKAQEFIDRWERVFSGEPLASRRGEVRMQTSIFDGSESVCYTDHPDGSKIVGFHLENYVPGKGREGIRIICKAGLRKRPNLKQLLLLNETEQEDMLKCVWMRELRARDAGYRAPQKPVYSWQPPSLHHRWLEAHAKVCMRSIHNENCDRIC